MYCNLNTRKTVFYILLPCCSAGRGSESLKLTWGKNPSGSPVTFPLGWGVGGREGYFFLLKVNVQEQIVWTNSLVPVTTTIVRMSVENIQDSGSYAECFRYVT